MKRAVVIEPFTHVAPTGEGWAEGLEALGWEVDRRNGLTLTDNAWPLVVLFDVPFSALSDPVPLRIMKGGGAKIVAVVSDTPHFDIATAAPYVSAFVAHTLRDIAMDASFAAAGATLHHLPFGARQFFAECVPQEPEYDVAFIGSLFHGDRGENKYLTPLLNPLMNKGLRVFVAGCLGRSPIPYRETAKIYERTKVAINFHYPHQKREDRAELNGRTFDLAAAGCFQLSDHADAVQFASVPTLDNGCKWAAYVHAALEDPERRRGTADQARGTVRSAHMWKHRMAEMLEWLP